MNLHMNAHEGRVCRGQDGWFRLDGQERPRWGSNNLAEPWGIKRSNGLEEGPSWQRAENLQTLGLVSSVHTGSRKKPMQLEQSVKHTQWQEMGSVWWSGPDLLAFWPSGCRKHGFHSRCDEKLFGVFWAGGAGDLIYRKLFWLCGESTSGWRNFLIELLVHNITTKWTASSTWETPVLSEVRRNKDCGPHITRMRRGVFPPIFSSQWVFPFQFRLSNERVFPFLSSLKN